MAFYFGYILGVLLISVLPITLLNAKILTWRALKMQNWQISFKNAYIVSIKAYLIGFLFGCIAAITLFFLNIKTNNPLTITMPIFFIAWYYMHSNMLLKLTNKPSSFTIKEAKSISNKVGLFLFGTLFLLVPLLVFVIFFIFGLSK